MKKCVRCEQTKPLDDFYLRKRSSGISVPHSYCKKCAICLTREWQKENPGRRNVEAKRAYQRDWHKTEYGREHKRGKQKKAIERLSNAYVRGLIKGRNRLLVVTKEMIVMKREQLILQRLTKELKREIINQLENGNGN